MEIIIDCGDTELAKAIADKLSEETGVARDKFKENTDETIQEQQRSVGRNTG